MEPSSSSSQVDQLRDYLSQPSSSQKTAELQRQFASILHANKCLKLQTNNYCTIPVCPQWKVFLMHYNKCEDGFDCAFPNCATSRVLLDHFQGCKNMECSFCVPLKNKNQKRRQRQESTSSSHIFVQSPASSCSFEQTTHTFNSRSCTSSASQAYFRKWGDWGQTVMESSTTTFFARQNRKESFVEEMNDDNPVELVGKAERIQRELVVMLHVQKCADMDVEELDRRTNVICAVPHCSRMKRTLIHLAMCREPDCQFPECDVTRSIVDHWLRCRRDSCSICAPVVKFMPALDGEQFDDDGRLVNLLYTASSTLIKLNQSDIQTECLSPSQQAKSINNPPDVIITEDSSFLSTPNVFQQKFKRDFGSISSESSSSSSNSSLNSSRQTSFKRPKTFEHN